ncbi:MAG: 3-phosphoshikimate 1-carboxyvinyltransferase, partial [Actinomycetota bacterium]
MDITIHPVRRLRGTLRVPGDKSISHRGLLLGAMAKGRSRIEGAAPGQDVASTLASLRILGVDVEPAGEGRIEISGPGWEVSGGATLDAGNSATTMRLLAGALAGRPGTYVLGGDGSLSRRPMDRVAIPLRRMGAGISLLDNRYPPIRLRGGRLSAISYRLPVSSAQVKGAILLAGLQAAGATRISEPAPSRDHTERLLGWLGTAVSSTP